MTTSCICEYGIGRPGESEHSKSCKDYQKTQERLKYLETRVKELEPLSLHPDYYKKFTRL